MAEYVRKMEDNKEKEDTGSASDANSAHDPSSVSKRSKKRTQNVQLHYFNVILMYNLFWSICL